MQLEFVFHIFFIQDTDYDKLLCLWGLITLG